MAVKSKANEEIHILEMSYGHMTVHLVGNSPLIFHKMDQKAQRELLKPAGKRRTNAERAQTLKHDPVAEFRASPIMLDNPKANTLLALPATAFKGAIMTAAKDIPGATKSQLGRLITVMGSRVEIYGVPKLYMTTVRNSDINRTPDIRTRAKMEEWACKLDITYVQPNLSARSIINLLAASGMVCGVGDFRVEKGAGDYGRYRIVDEDDEDYLRIMSEGDRAVQQQYMQDAIPYDNESYELLEWFNEQIALKGEEDRLSRPKKERVAA